MINDNEKKTYVIKKIVKSLEADLRDFREFNDSTSLNAEDTSFLRGKIFMTKRIIDSLKPNFIVQADDDEDSEDLELDYEYT